MKEKVKKCPLCSKKMQKSGSYMICDECGYRILTEGSQNDPYSDMPYSGSSLYTGSSSGSSLGSSRSSVSSDRYSSGSYTKGNSGSVKNSYQPQTGKKTAYTSVSPKRSTVKHKSRNTGTALVLFISLFIILSTVAFGFFINHLGAFDADSDNMDVFPTIMLTITPDDIFSDDEQQKYFEEIFDNTESNTSSENTVSAYIPKSELFRALVEYIFCKSPEEVTADEYALVTYLKFYNYTNKVDYILDGELNTFVYNNYLYPDFTDILCFTGLETLDAKRCTLYEGDLDGLDKLTCIYTENSVSELAEILPDSSKITELGIIDYWELSNLDGIENFPNVTRLYIEATALTDISGIEKLTKLTELTIKNCNCIENFDALNKIRNVSNLYIDSNQLTDISFVENLKLEELYLSSYVTDISVLSSQADTLKKLTLDSNYELEDYTVISELVNLEDLYLYAHYSLALPSFDKLDKLTSLYLEAADNTDIVTGAKNLTNLTLRFCSMDDWNKLTNLDSITELHIYAPWSFPDNLDFINNFKNLRVLEIGSIYFYDNTINNLFSLPGLEELYLDNCYARLDFEALSINTTLNTLSMNSMDIFIYGDDGWRYSLSMPEYTDLFLNFPNLTNLSVRNNELTDVEFIKDLNLTKLEVLDISNNYISSLEPLSSLESLNVVWCANNEISDLEVLGDNVTVIHAFLPN